MTCYYKKLGTSPPSTTSQPIINVPQPIELIHQSSLVNFNVKSVVDEFQANELEAYPGVQKNINIVALNDKEKDRIRKTFLLKGPFQPKNMTRLLLTDTMKRPGNFVRHIGEHNNIHKNCKIACDMLMNRKQYIDIALSQQSDKAKNDYRVQLIGTIDCVRFFLLQRLAFRGNDEAKESMTRGNFLHLLNFLTCHNDIIELVFKSAADHNNKLTTPSIQKDITNACSILTSRAIISELGG